MKGRKKTMEKTIFEEMGGAYVRRGDYNLPCLSFPTEKENRPIGVWGRDTCASQTAPQSAYVNPLKWQVEHYLADIDEQAEDLFFRLVL